MTQADQDASVRERSQLARTLTKVFILALFMGPGPGLYLINPEVYPAVIFGVPIVYAWAVFWFGVLASVVVVAYVRLWSREEEA